MVGILFLLEKGEMKMSELIRAFATVIFYNGYEDSVRTWIEQLELHNENFCLMDYIPNRNDATYYQLQVLNMMLVELFGDCGTSPRFGWIEKLDECKEFLQKTLAEIKTE